MVKGIIFALSACFIWGFIFIIPPFIKGFTPLEIALGRYFFFGAISLCVFIKKKACRERFQYPLSYWIRALTFALISNVFYYTLLVLALGYSNPAICALILGLSPITIAFYGNWQKKECSFKSLILPSCIIFVGLVIINAPHIKEDASSFLLGFVCAMTALISWSWYAVENAKFLKKHPNVHSSNWATLMGMATLCWVLLIGLLQYLFFSHTFDKTAYVWENGHLLNFLLGCATLGILCSWVGTYLWNKASLYLPISLAGQLTVFETICGILFFYGIQQTLPPLLEGIGIVVLLGGIAYGIRKSMTTYEPVVLPNDE